MQMLKRKIIPTSPFVKTCGRSVVYLLIYFSNEKRYAALSAQSTCFSAGSHPEEMKIGEAVNIKQDGQRCPGVVIAKGTLYLNV